MKYEPNGTHTLATGLVALLILALIGGCATTGGESAGPTPRRSPGRTAGTKPTIG